MKSTTIKKVGAVLAGFAMLTSPALGQVDLDDVDKSFFYENDYTPRVKIVVGGNATQGGPYDYITAGNIAATIGNLAYVENADTYGEFGIDSTVRKSVGDYIKESNREVLESFYDEKDALSDYQMNGVIEYEPGDFNEYMMSCGEDSVKDASILKESSFYNIHCKFCNTLCDEDKLENPKHEMEESLIVDGNKIWTFYEDEEFGLSIEDEAIEYKVKTGGLPVTTLKDVDGDEIDSEYRGKILFQGEEYFVKDISGDEVILGQGRTLDDIELGDSAEFKGYDIALDHLIYSGDYVVAGALVKITKPDGTSVQRKISKYGNAAVDDIDVAGVSAGDESLSLIAYDMDSEIVLEDGDNLVVDGEEDEYWEVQLSYSENFDEVDDYSDVDEGLLLDEITLRLDEDIEDEDALNTGDSFEMFSNLELIFNGFTTDSYSESEYENVVFEVGDEPYTMMMNDLRLDNGPFEEGDEFMVGGEVYELTELKEVEDDDNDNLDTVEVEIKKTDSVDEQDIVLYRACDEEDDTKSGNVSWMNTTVTNGADQNVSCSVVDEVIFESKAIRDAEDDDEEFEYDADELFFTETEINGVEMVVLKNSDGLILSKKNPWMGSSEHVIYLSDGDILTPSDEEAYDGFEDEGNELAVRFVNENGTDDMNSDGDTNDFLINVTNEYTDEPVTVDFGDRNNSGDEDYSNSVMLPDVRTLDEDDESKMMTPNGDEYILDWGSDDRLDVVEINHPIEEVGQTVFVGVSEQVITEQDIISSDMIGETVTAGCCEFTIGNYSTERTYNPVKTGKLVYDESEVNPETNSDTNYVLVGGPAVNGMTKPLTSAQELKNASNRFIVDKYDNKIMVAGYYAEDTEAAGDALIKWLTENAHAE